MAWWLWLGLIVLSGLIGLVVGAVWGLNEGTRHEAGAVEDAIKRTRQEERARYGRA